MGACLNVLCAETLITWSEEYYNPKPQNGDVILPLPCGGAMVFRRVAIESTGPLADQRVDLGMSDEQWGFTENTMAAHIAGSFTSKSDSSRNILFGKYEVSQLQYQALVNSECPKPTKKLRLPQNRINWFDAVQFSNDWSIWLLKNAPEILPIEDGEPGFIRLPTEAEWEYAARGGNAVSISDFRERIFPMPKGMERYVWFAGTRSANGKPQLTGLLSPNPLGLYDMLGNVDEVTLEPFRLNRLDRFHGQVGGYVVRGGNYFTSQEDIRASHRQEVPHFNKAGARRSKTTGFRVVVSAPVITSAKRLQEIQRAWGLLGTEKTEEADARGGEYVDAQAKDDPVQELEVLSAASKDDNMKIRLKRLKSIMRATLEERNQQRDNAVKASLRAGGIICGQIGEDANLVSILTKRVKNLCISNQVYTEEKCKKLDRDVDDKRNKYDKNINLYADLIITVARNYHSNILMKQSELLDDELSNTTAGRRLAKFVDVYQSQVIGYSKNWLVKRKKWSESCHLAVMEK
jgi:hypothetical protein